MSPAQRNNSSGRGYGSQGCCAMSQNLINHVYNNYIANMFG